MLRAPQHGVRPSIAKSGYNQNLDGRQAPDTGIDVQTCRRIMSIALTVAATMDVYKSLYESLTDWLSFLGVGIRAALTPGIKSDDESNGGNDFIDPDFDGWLVNDPMVTLNPTSRYGDDATGFLSEPRSCGREISAMDG